MERRTHLSWRSGKDSAWALYVLRQDPDIDVVGVCTINQAFDRVAIHAVSVDLLRKQARRSANVENSELLLQEYLD